MLDVVASGSVHSRSGLRHRMSRAANLSGKVCRDDTSDGRRTGWLSAHSRRA